MGWGLLSTALFLKSPCLPSWSSSQGSISSLFWCLQVMSLGPFQAPSPSCLSLGFTLLEPGCPIHHPLPCTTFLSHPQSAFTHPVPAMTFTPPVTQHLHFPDDPAQVIFSPSHTFSFLEWLLDSCYYSPWARCQVQRTKLDPVWTLIFNAGKRQKPMGKPQSAFRIPIRGTKLWAPKGDGI